MLDLLLQRSTVVTLAIIGGVLSLAISVLSARGVLSDSTIKHLNKIAYVFMGLSIIFFIAAGIVGPLGG